MRVHYPDVQGCGNKEFAACFLTESVRVRRPGLFGRRSLAPYPSLVSGMA